MTKPLEALKADADSSPGGILVALVTDDGDADILVPPPGRWKARTNAMLNNGNFSGWAQAVLAAEDVAEWNRLDPTNDDVEAFFKAWQAASGESSPKSPASKRSSRSTARR